jgi:hypothetical protein
MDCRVKSGNDEEKEAGMMRARGKNANAPHPLSASRGHSLPARSGEREKIDDDPVPENIDAFRLELARRIATFLKMPRRCRAPICRRHKRCLDPTLRCQRDFPPRPMSPEQTAAMQAAVRRAVERRLAREP